MCCISIVEILVLVFTIAHHSWDIFILYSLFKNSQCNYVLSFAVTWDN